MTFIARSFTSLISTRWVLLLFVTNVVLLLVSFSEESTSPILMSLILSGLGLCILRNRNEESDLFIIGFCVSLLYGLFLYYYYYSVNGAPFFNVPLSDDSSYERDGLEYAEQLGIFEYGRISPSVVSPTHNSKGYVLLIGVIGKFSDYIGGYHTLLPRIFNAFLHSFCVVFLFRLMRLYHTNSAQCFMVAVLFACFPHLVYLSGHIYRDTLVCFAFTFCIYTSLKENTSLIDWLYIALIVTGLSQLRFFSMIMLVGSLGLIVLFTRVRNKKLRLTILGVGVAVVVGSVVFINAVSGTFSGTIWGMLIDSQAHYTALRSSAEYSTGIAAKILQMDILPFGFIARSAYLSINPLPFLDFKLPIFINGLGTLLQLPLFVYASLFTYKNFKNRNLLPLSFALWFPFVSIALTSFQLRHMVMFYPFLFVLGALGYFELKSNEKLKKKILYWTVFLGGVGVWLYLHNKLLS